MLSNIAVWVGKYPAGVPLVRRIARVRHAGGAVEEIVLMAGAHVRSITGKGAVGVILHTPVRIRLR